MPDDRTPVEQVADVLQEHSAGPADRDARWHCTCGWVSEPFVRFALTIHQADMLAAAGLVPTGAEAETGATTMSSSTIGQLSPLDIGRPVRITSMGTVIEGRLTSFAVQTRDRLKAAAPDRWVEASGLPLDAEVTFL